MIAGIIALLLIIAETVVIISIIDEMKHLKWEINGIQKEQNSIQHHIADVEKAADQTQIWNKTGEVIQAFNQLVNKYNKTAQTVEHLQYESYQRSNSETVRKINEKKEKEDKKNDQK